MPAAIPAIASAVGTAFSAIGTALTATGIGATLLKLGVSVGLSILSRPKKPKDTSIATGTQVSFKADTNAGVPLVLGRTATGGNIIHVSTNGQEGHNIGLTYVVALSTGPCAGFDEFWVNNQQAAFGYNGNSEVVANGTWAGNMALRQFVGAQPDSWQELLGIADKDTTWDQTKVLSGLCYSMWFLSYDQQKYPTGVPQPMWVLRGPRVYDPRRDSTYPGGNGNQRPNDWTTWDFLGNDNPYLQALTWCLGHWQNGKLVHGAGIPISAIDVQAFIEGANMCDFYMWKIGGVVTSADKKWDVLKAMLQAGGGEPIKAGGKVSCISCTPKMALATIYTEHIKGKVTVTGTKSRRDRYNRIIPRYRSPDHNWQIISANPVSYDEFVSMDYGVRSKEIEYSLVQNVSQASQLAMYDIQNSREREPISIPLGIQWADYKVGDALNVQAPELGLDPRDVPVKVVILKRDIDLEQATCTLHCRTETDAKHNIALTTIGQGPSPNHLPGWSPDYLTAPAWYAWLVQGATLTSDNGQQVPIIRVYGGADNPWAHDVIVNYRKEGGTGADYFFSTVIGPAGNFWYDKVTINISTVTENTPYEVRLAYRDKLGVISPWTYFPEVWAGQASPPAMPEGMYAVVSTSNVQGYMSDWNVVDVVSDPVTAGAVGGTPPYSYSWGQIDGTPMYVTQWNSSVVQFHAPLPPGPGIFGTWRVTVTDSLEATATKDVHVSLFNITPGWTG